MEKFHNYFGFMGETGILNENKHQRFFALGLLKMNNTSNLYNELNKIRNRAKQYFNVSTDKDFEFKFSSIKKRSIPFYKEILDNFFSETNIEFHCLIIDKEKDSVDIANNFNSMWDAYIEYSQILIHNNMKDNEQIAILADHFQKPNNATQSFEYSIQKNVKTVYNACMLESHASLFIQLVDILVGCVRYDFQRQKQTNFVSGKNKAEVVEFVTKILGKEHIGEGFSTKSGNVKFNVWDFEPKKK